MRNSIFGAIALFVTLSATPAQAHCQADPNPAVDQCAQEVSTWALEYQNEYHRARAEWYAQQASRSSQQVPSQVTRMKPDSQQSCEPTQGGGYVCSQSTRRPGFFDYLAAGIAFGSYGNYGSGSHGRSGGYDPGSGYGGSVDRGRQTQPLRVYCNPRAGQYCP